MFSPVDLPSGRLPSLLIAWEVCHRSDPSSALPHDLGENSQGRKLLILANALRGKCPSPTQFPYQPSVIGIVPGSACIKHFHIVIMFIQNCQHIVQGYVSTRAPYQLSRIALQGSYGIGQEGAIPATCTLIHG